VTADWSAKFAKDSRSPTLSWLPPITKHQPNRGNWALPNVVAPPRQELTTMAAVPR
jgi:hypothetical protein